MSEVVLEQRRGPALWITMNRPDKLNALSGELVEACARASAEPLLTMRSRSSC